MSGRNSLTDNDDRYVNDTWQTIGFSGFFNIPEHWLWVYINIVSFVLFIMLNASIFFFSGVTVIHATSRFVYQMYFKCLNLF